MCIRNNVRHPSCTPETTSVRPHCGHRNPVFGHPYVNQKHVSAPSCGHVRHDSMLQAMFRYTSGHFLCIINNFRALPVCIINVWATPYVHQKPHPFAPTVDAQTMSVDTHVCIESMLVRPLVDMLDTTACHYTCTGIRSLCVLQKLCPGTSCVYQKLLPGISCVHTKPHLWTALCTWDLHL